MDEIYKYVASLLEYDPENGEFTWTSCKEVLTRLRGKAAGSTYSDGYVYIRYGGRRLLAHRIAWVKLYGVLPECSIDHINMNKSDNRQNNLRSATLTENNRNRAKQSNNTSGYKGVTFHRGTGKYQAKICVNKQRISLGYFDDPLVASGAYQQAAKEHHGEFARHK